MILNFYFFGQDLLDIQDKTYLNQAFHKSKTFILSGFWLLVLGKISKAFFYSLDIKSTSEYI